MKYRTVFKWGWSLHFVHHTRDITCVENYWFCEVIIQVERVINYQLARPTEFRGIRNLELDLPDNIMLQKSGLKF